MKLQRFTFAALVVLLLVGFYWHQQEIHTESEYLTSETCKSCHPSPYAHWEKSLHPRQFRPIGPNTPILGDFSSDDPALTFTKADIEYVIGNRYEQVYARMIDGEYYPLPAKWYVEEGKWVPYKVETWRETPLSTKCNGCHTTGFNAETLEFSEFGIGCEACHGPGGLHVQNQRMEQSDWCTPCHLSGNYSIDGEIVSTVNSAVCGQCHSRGVQFKDKDHMRTGFNFPVSFKPGQELPKDFTLTSPHGDKKGKYWWGVGLSKKRHQEYADFNLSGHSKSLRNLLESRSTNKGEQSASCLTCHSADYRMSQDDQKPDLDNAKHGITCVVCHDPHRLIPDSHERNQPSEICGTCHAALLAEEAAAHGKPHYPCPTVQVSCADCHMPYIVKTGGGYHLRSHAFHIVRPQDTRDLNMPNSCQNGGCHADQSLGWAEQAFNDFYLDDEMETTDQQPVAN